MDDVASLLTVMMPTVAKVAPKVFESLKQYAGKRNKFSETFIVSMAMIEMNAQMVQRVDELTNSINGHQEWAQRSVENIVDILKYVRGRIENTGKGVVA